MMKRMMIAGLVLYQLPTVRPGATAHALCCTRNPDSRVRENRTHGLMRGRSKWSHKTD